MRVLIDDDARERLWAFIRAVEVEVGGMGYAFLQDDGSIHWLDTFLIPQEVSSTEVDFEATGGDQHAVERAIADGVLNDPRFVWVSWHSHHTMKAYWSDTDDKRIAAMGKVGIKRLLSLVGCHDHTYQMRFDLFDVKAHGVEVPQVTISDVGFAPVKQEPTEFEKAIAAEIKENVTEKKHRWTKGKNAAVSSVVADTVGSLADLAGVWDVDEDDDQERRRILSELEREGGLPRRDAEDMLDTFGVKECDDMLWNGEITMGGHR